MACVANSIRPARPKPNQIRPRAKTPGAADAANRQGQGGAEPPADRRGSGFYSRRFRCKVNFMQVSLRTVWFVLGALLLGAGAVLFKPGSKSPPGQPSPAAAFTAGQTQTHTTLSTSTTTSAPENALFGARHLLVWVEDEHPFLQRLTPNLVQRLRQVPGIETVTELRPEKPWPEGQRAPDLFLRLGLEGFTDQGVLRQSLDATVTADLGNAPWRSTYFVQDQTTPPVVAFAWHGAHQERSDFQGLRTDRLAAAAASVADAFAKAISNHVVSFSQKYQPLPDLPADFFGPYEPVNDPDALRQVKAQRRFSGPGLFTRNETFWTFQAPAQPGLTLAALVQDFEADGWQLSQAASTSQPPFRLHLQRADAEMEIFERSSERASPGSRPSPEVTRFVARFRLPFSPQAREAALQSLLDRGASVEAMLPFWNLCSPAQRAQFIKLAEKVPVASPQVCLRLAEYYLGRQQTNAAARMLLHAQVLAFPLREADALRSSIDSLAGRVAPGTKAELIPTAETCRELGLVEVRAEFTPTERVLPLGQPLRLFYAGEQGLELGALTVEPARNGLHAYTLMSGRDGNRSWSASSFPAGQDRPWNQTWSLGGTKLALSAAPLPAEGNVRYRIEPTP